MITPAPLHLDIADAPDGGRAFWVTTPDDVRIRMAIWEGGVAGTVLLLPGRTEYIEKYGQVVGELTRRGYNCMVIDWRGQGLSARLTADSRLGHVENFADFQTDLTACLATSEVSSLPGPRFMLAHSMGGCIGYRALLDGLKVQAAFFSAPMWGIRMPLWKVPAAHFLSFLMPLVGRGATYVIGGEDRPYVSVADAGKNELTSDRAQFERMQSQLLAHPEFGLAGPSYKWLGAALSELRTFRREPPPSTPCTIVLGGEETVVSSTAIRNLAPRIPRATLVVIPGARHEILIEKPAVLTQVWDLIDKQFDSGSRLT